MRIKKGWQAFYDRARPGGAPGFPRFKAWSRWATGGFDELADCGFRRSEAIVKGRHALGGLKLPGVQEKVDMRTGHLLPACVGVRVDSRPTSPGGRRRMPRD